MPSTVHPITARAKGTRVDPARRDDFALGEGENVDTAALVADRTWSAYCLDGASNCLVLTELDDGHDLARAPFVYMDQFDNARRVALVPVDELLALAPPPPRPDPLLVFSIGRCGSTLVSRILSHLPGIWAISEPDVALSIAQQDSDRTEGETAALLRAALGTCLRPPRARDGDRPAWKFRSQSSFDAAQLAAAFPQGRAIYLYRDPAGWANSLYRFAQRIGVSDETDEVADYAHAWRMMSAGGDIALLGEYCDITGPTVPLTALLAAGWALNIAEFARVAAAFPGIETFSYRQINEAREETVDRLAALAGVPGAARAAGLKAYAADAQAGSGIGRAHEARGLGPEKSAEIGRLLTRAGVFDRLPPELADARPDRM